MTNSHFPSIDPLPVCFEAVCVNGVSEQPVEEAGKSLGHFHQGEFESEIGNCEDEREAIDELSSTKRAENRV